MGTSSVSANFEAEDTVLWSREASDLFQITQQVSGRQDVEPCLLTPRLVFFFFYAEYECELLNATVQFTTAKTVALKSPLFGLFLFSLYRVFIIYTDGSSFQVSKSAVFC